MVTHAHNDHNSDLESLLTLFYTRNKNKKTKTTVDLYLNTGAFQKFSGLINLRSMTYLNRMHTLMPGHEYRINEHTVLKSLDAYHDEVITKSYAVGLWFTVNQGDEERNIIISSDTSLFPPGKDDETVDPDPEKEIWKTYGLDGRKINLLVPHLGSIKKREFIRGYEKPEKIFYPNHLGILGTAVLITHIEPELAVISEFGEELRIIQENLVKLIEKVVGKTTSGKVKLLPGDKGFIYDVINKEVCCQYTRKMVPYDKIKYDCLPEPEREFVYYCDETGFAPFKAESKAKEFKDERKKGNLKFCHK